MSKRITHFLTVVADDQTGSCFMWFPGGWYHTRVKPCELVLCGLKKGDSFRWDIPATGVLSPFDIKPHTRRFEVRDFDKLLALEDRNLYLQLDSD